MSVIYCVQDSKGANIGCYTSSDEANRKCQDLKQKLANKNLLAAQNVPAPMLDDSWNFLFVHYNLIFGINSAQIANEVANVTEYSVVSKNLS